MRKLSAYTLVATALFCSALSLAAGGAEETTGFIFGALGLLVWLEALLLDYAYLEV